MLFIPGTDPRHATYVSFGIHILEQLLSFLVNLGNDAVASRGQNKLVGEGAKICRKCLFLINNRRDLLGSLFAKVSSNMLQIREKKRNR